MCNEENVWSFWWLTEMTKIEKRHTKHSRHSHLDTLDTSHRHSHPSPGILNSKVTVVALGMRACCSFIPTLDFHLMFGNTKQLCLNVFNGSNITMPWCTLKIQVFSGQIAATPGKMPTEWKLISVEIQWCCVNFPPLPNRPSHVSWTQGLD